MSVQVASLLVKVGADVREATSGLADVDRAFGSTSKKAEQFKGDLSKFTLGAGAVFSGLAAGAGKLAIDFESSFAGVRKTVDATEAEYKSLAGAFRDMAKEIPVSVNELNRIAESAGQLGVKKADIVDFTRVIAMLGDTTNLAGQEAATGVARFANVTGMAIADTDRFAATLVDLGNNAATTEAEILAMALRIGAAGSQVGMSEAQILSFAAALSSVGVEAEAGGSSISRVFIEIDKAVADGGERLAFFAQVAGMSVDQFKRAWGQDAANAVLAFIKGLDGVKDAGGNAFKVLEDLELGEIRVRDSLLRAANAQGMFTDLQERGNTAWAENLAHIEEANKRWETTASRLRVAMNNAVDLGIAVGDHLLPAIVAVADYASANLPRAFDWLDETFGPKIAAAADALGSLAGYAETAARWLGQNEEAVTSLAEAFALATVAMVGLGAAMFAVAVMTNPFVQVYAGAVALSLVVTLLANYWDEYAAAGQRAMDEVADAVDSGAAALNQMADAMGNRLDDLGQWFADLPGAINDALGDTAETLYQAGGDLIDGMWEGAKDRAEDFGGWLRDLPGEIVGWVKDAADGHSPWGITEPLGEDLIAGMIVGIENATPDLAAAGALAVSTVTGAMATQLGSDLAQVDRSAATWAAGFYQRLAAGNFQTLTGPDGVDLSQADRYWISQAALDQMPFWTGAQGPSTGAVGGSTNPWSRDAFADPTKSTLGSSFSGFSGSGGGGAAEAARTAAEEFAAAWAAEARSGSLAEAFGKTGGSLMDAFAASMESPSSAARIPDIIGRLVDEARELGVPNAKELGENLAAAIAAGLETGATAEVESALTALTEKAKEAGKLTVESFGTAMAAKAADRRLLDQIGSGGKAIMDAFHDALDKGGKASITKLADQVDGMVAKLMDKAPEGQAAYLGTSMMEALSNAINNHGAEAQARLAAVLANVNTIMQGGAIDIRTGTIIAADAIRDLAKAFDADGKTLVENIQVIVDSGLTGWLGMLDKIPESARTAIAELLNVLERGVFDADNLAKRLATLTPGGGSGSGGSGDSGSGASSAQVFPGETIAELVARVTGVDVFGGEGSVFDQNGRYMSASDITAAVISGKFVSDFIYGKYTTGANPMVSGSVTKEGFVPNPPYDGSHEMGLPYVPYDGYLAQLHKGERVVPARENRGYGAEIHFHINAIDARSVDDWLRNGGGEQVTRAVLSEMGRQW